MGFFQEFKAFALKGNVIDLAVAVIIGGGFAKIVDSVVADLIMPVAGVVVGRLEFSRLYWALGAVPPGTAPTVDALRKAGVPVLAYGNFITVAVNFTLLAFIIFCMVKLLGRLKRGEPEAAPPATPEEILLLREIRDQLARPHALEATVAKDTDAVTP